MSSHAECVESLESDGYWWMEGNEGTWCEFLQDPAATMASSFTETIVAMFTDPLVFTILLFNTTVVLAAAYYFYKLSDHHE